MATAILISNGTDTSLIPTGIKKAVRTFRQSVRQLGGMYPLVKSFHALRNHHLKDPYAYRSEISDPVYGRAAERVQYHEV